MCGNFTGGDKDEDVREMVPHIIPMHIQVLFLCQCIGCIVMLVQGF